MFLNNVCNSVAVLAIFNLSEGVYEVKGLPVTPYLVPQDCGMHMDSDWVEICRSTGLNVLCPLFR